MKKLFFIIFVISLSSCSSKKDNLLSEIDKLETSIKNNIETGNNNIEANNLLNLYIKYIETYKTDSNSLILLNKASHLSLSLNKPKLSLELLEKIISDFPKENDYVANSYVFSGYIYENFLNNTEKARYWYILFLEKFPNHDLAEDAKYSLNNLEKTNEEIFEELLNKIEENEQ